MKLRQQHFDPQASLDALLAWLTETTQASRMARLSTTGMQFRPYKEPNTDGWQTETGVIED